MDFSFRFIMVIFDYIFWNKKNIFHISKSSSLGQIFNFADWNRIIMQVRQLNIRTISSSQHLLYWPFVIIEQVCVWVLPIR